MSAETNTGMNADPTGRGSLADVPGWDGFSELERDTARVCRDLLRIDTSNYGDGSGPGEAAAADYVRDLLGRAGYEVSRFESDPGRVSLVCRVPGSEPGLPALVVHGHLDVVPARAEDWTHHPFSGDVAEGMLWGRGAVDMKDMVAMMVAVLLHWSRRGAGPRRDMVFAFFADEEAGGLRGAHWMVENHPEVFAGATEAISEVGGFSVQVGGRRAYMLQTAEKSILWLKLTATGRAGHGSQVTEDNAVAKVAEAVHRIATHRWGRHLTPTTEALLERVGQALGTDYRQGEELPEAGIGRLLEDLGFAARFVGATFQDTANPTVLKAGYKHNVVPGRAEALLDCRTLPGHEEQVMDTLRSLLPAGVELSVVHRDVSLESPMEGSLVEGMVGALRGEDPDALVLPYMLSGGTDNKALSRLGITGYGFAPLRLPADLDFPGMFHGVDERVPVASLAFGARVLDRLLSTH